MKHQLVAIFTCILVSAASGLEDSLCSAHGSCRDVEDEALLQFHASSTGKRISSYCDTGINTAMNFCCWSQTCNGDPDCCSSCGPQGACQFPDGDGYGISQQGTCANDPANQCAGTFNASDDTEDPVTEVAFCDIEVDRSQNFCCWSKTCNGDAECCSSCGPQGACQFPDGHGFGVSQQGTCANNLANQCAGAGPPQVDTTQEEYCDAEIDHSRPFCCWAAACKYEKDPAACCASCGPQGACQFPNDEEHNFGFGSDKDRGTCANTEVNQCPLPSTSEAPTASDDTFCDVEIDKSKNFCCWSKACNGDPDCCSYCEATGSCQFPDGDGYGVSQHGTCANDPANQCAAARLVEVNATRRMTKEQGQATKKEKARAGAGGATA